MFGAIMFAISIQECIGVIEKDKEREREGGRDKSSHQYSQNYTVRLHTIVVMTGKENWNAMLMVQN